MSDFAAALVRDCPMPLADFMARCNAHYYATRDPLGAAGDFVTAPEISQMFGELIGLWCADLWQRSGSPARIALVELGPGRGTLMRDALRASGRVPGFADAAELHLIETSPVLRDIQAAALAQARWHRGLETLPLDCPLIVIGNEFLDALPVAQLQLLDGEWRERWVGHDGGRFCWVTGPARPERPGPGLAEGAIVERSVAAEGVAAALGARLVRQGGAALIIDYGHAHGGTGETLQAVRGHRFADPLEAPGESDLTAHVDFAAVAAAARATGARVHGPTPQAQLLARLGLAERAAALARAQPQAEQAIASACDRLVSPDHMGQLFKALAIAHPDWIPAGFPT